MVNLMTIKRQLLSRQRWSKVRVPFLISCQHSRFELRRFSAVRWSAAALMHYPPITLLAIPLV